MDKAAQQHSGGGSSNSSSRSSSRATSAGSSPSSGARGLLAGPGRVNQQQAVAVAGKLDAGAAQTSREQRQVVEGVLCKYTNLLQGWQNRYFILDFDSGILQYFVTEASKTQKPRGFLSLSGSVISLSDEAPHMIVVYSASGEVYKLKAADSKERQFWLTQLQACAKHHTESKSSLSQRARSFSLLPHGTTNSSSPGSQRHLTHGGPSVVTITHHKSPAAARRSKNQNPAHLHEVKEVMAEVEGQQKNLVHAIESLSGSGPLSALDQDLLLLKATSAATLSCLGECLHILQQSVYQAGQNNKPVMSESILGWHGPKSHSTENLRNGSYSSLPSATANLTWPMLPSTPKDYQILDQDAEERPAIWDTRRDEYHDRTTKDRDWEEIAMTLLPSTWGSANLAKKEKIIKDIKKRWYSCRDQFRQELDQKQHFGDGSLKKKPYIYTRQLQFLKDVMEVRSTVDNLSAESPRPAAAESSEQGLSQLDSSREEVGAEVLSEGQQSPDIPANTGATPPAEAPVGRSSGRQRRRPLADSELEVKNLVDSRVLQFLNQSRPDSQEERTLRSLSSSLSRVPVERQTRCLAAMAILIDIYASPEEPFEAVHHLERVRDRIHNIETPPSRLNRPDPPIVQTPGPFSRELFNL